MVARLRSAVDLLHQFVFELRIEPGQSVDLAGYHVAFKSVIPIKTSNYEGERGIFVVTRGGQVICLQAGD